MTHDETPAWTNFDLEDQEMDNMTYDLAYDDTDYREEFCGE